MKTSRMEAFSDGVLAIIITIMVLELKVPHEIDWASLRPIIPVFGSYVLSFIYVGIYWNNHHHLLHVTENVSGTALWANLHLLFWLSLIPFASGWLGENQLAAIPTAVYGVVLLMAGVAWKILQTELVSCANKNTSLKNAIGKDLKGWLSIGLYTIGIALAFPLPWAAIALYVAVAVIWFIPDRRLENAMNVD